MLYDPRWEVKNKPLDFSDQNSLLHSIVSWLETKDPEQSYDTRNVDTCLLGQWMASCGIEDAFMKSLILGTADPFRGVAGIGVPSVKTFGAALNRARASLG